MAEEYQFDGYEPSLSKGELEISGFGPLIPVPGLEAECLELPSLGHSLPFEGLK